MYTLYWGYVCHTRAPHIFQGAPDDSQLGEHRLYGYVSVRCSAVMRGAPKRCKSLANGHGRFQGQPSRNSRHDTSHAMVHLGYTYTCSLPVLNTLSVLLLLLCLSQRGWSTYMTARDMALPVTPGCLRHTIQQCAYCYVKKEPRGSTELHNCEKCSKRLYCSKECQSADWTSGHSHWCGTAGELNYDYEIRSSAGRGLGVFALRSFERNDR